MQRISVVGPTGSGKTTLAAAAGAALGFPVLELDAVHWGPDWTERDREAMREEVAAFVAGPAWVVDGNYRSESQDLVWGRADTVVWLDLPFGVVAGSLLRRTWRRIRDGTELWHGNRERLGTALSRESILLWLVKTHRAYRRRYEREAASGDWPGIEWIRLRSRREMDGWLAGLGR